MNLEKYVVVSGIPGVHKLVSTRGNGLIIDDLVEGRTRFVAIRQNPVTPLGTIGMYIDTDKGSDTVALGEVFQKMLDQLAVTPPPAGAAGPSQELRGYFATVFPEHDQDRVHINDIKKCIKWFIFMNEKGIFEAISKETPAEDASEASSGEEKTEA